MKPESKILRVWRGWTTLEKEKEYESFLVNEVFPTVKKNGVDGLEKVSISSKRLENEVEFYLVLQFDSLESVKQFAGDDYETAYIPEKAKSILSRYDLTAQHYAICDELNFT